MHNTISKYYSQRAHDFFIGKSYILLDQAVAIVISVIYTDRQILPSQTIGDFKEQMQTLMLMIKVAL